MAQNYPGIPGLGTERTVTPRTFLLSPDGMLVLPVGKTVKGSVSRDPLNTGNVDVLRDGLLMGKITADSKYAPCIIGVLASAYDRSASPAPYTAITVSAATATELVRRIGPSGTFTIVGPPSAAGVVATETVTYSAVNTTTGVITVTAPAVDYIAGSYVMPTDGSQAAKGLLLTEDLCGLKVTDADAASQDTGMPSLCIAGPVDASQIINYPSDASLITWLKAQMRATGGSWIFDDDF